MRDLTANVMNKPPLQRCRGGFLYTKAILYIIYRLIPILIRFKGAYMQEAKDQNTSNNDIAKDENKDKEKIIVKVLWVLALIFLFPFAIIVLIWRNKKLNIPSKITLIILSWFAYFLVMGLINGNKKDSVVEQPAIVVEEKIEEKQESDPAATDEIDIDVPSEEEKNEEVVVSSEPVPAPVEFKEYVKDKVDNRFINEFNNAYPDLQLTDIEHGNIITKNHAKAGNVSVEMINANNVPAKSFALTLDSGEDEDRNEKLIYVARKSIKILDPNISDQEIDKMFSDYYQKGIYFSDYEIGTLVVSFHPGMWNRSFIKIDAYDYK